MVEETINGTGTAGGGFDLDENVHEIVLEARQNGRLYKLTHFLREPTPKQWKEYQAKSNEVKQQRGDVELEVKTLAAQEKLWNEIIVRVEGYTKGGHPLVCEGEDWKRRIRILHKAEAIRALGDVWRQRDDSEKNSETASEE